MSKGQTSRTGDCVGWTVIAASQMSNESFLQKGGEAALSAASFFYALKIWSPMRKVQTVVFRSHDTLSLPWRYKGKKYNALVIYIYIYIYSPNNYLGSVCSSSRRTLRSCGTLTMTMWRRPPTSHAINKSPIGGVHLEGQYEAERDDGSQ